MLARPVGPQPCNGHCSRASPAALCRNPGAGHSQSKGASPQPHAFCCSHAAKPSQPRKMAGCVDDAGSRQREGDGDLSLTPCGGACPTRVQARQVTAARTTSPEPGRSQEGVLSRDLCPQHCFSGYVDVCMKQGGAPVLRQSRAKPDTILKATVTMCTVQSGVTDGCLALSLSFSPPSRWCD